MLKIEPNYNENPFDIKPRGIKEIKMSLGTRYFEIKDMDWTHGYGKNTHAYFEMCKSVGKLVKTSFVTFRK